jgi:hypothetical protein
VTTAWVASPAELEIRLHQSLIELRLMKDQGGSPTRRVKTARELTQTPAPPPTSWDNDHDTTAPLVPLWTHLDQPEIGDAIALLRQHCRLTRGALIQRMWDVSDKGDLGVDQSLVYRWEKGEKGRARPRPGAEYRKLLGLVCEREVRNMSAIDRREFLQRLAAFAAPPLLSGSVVLDPARLAFAGSPDAQLLDGMRALTRSYVTLHNTVSPSAVRLAITRHFDDLTALALRSRQSSVAERARTMAAQTAILAGWVSFNLQDVGQALMYWTVAHDMAGEVGDLSLQAHALGSRSRLYSPIHSSTAGADPYTALAFLDRAVRLAHGGASAAMRSWLHANRAQQFAATNQATESQRDLEESARLASLGQLGDDDVLAGWDEVRVDAYRGICAMQLRQPAEVIAVTESVLARTDPGRVQRCLQQSDLAAAYALLGEVDRATSLLHEALTVANRAQFVEGVNRAIGVRRHYLRDHSRTRSVRELDDRIATIGRPELSSP